MYGKTLEDFPERFNAFATALADMGEAEINAGFEWAMRHLNEFPLPVHIRECSEAAKRSNQAKLAEEAQRNQRLIEDRLKDERFDNTDSATRRKEFAEMIAAAARKVEMPPAPEPEKTDPEGAPRVVPPNIAAAKGPEWEARLRKQVDEMRRKAAESADGVKP